MPKMKTRKSVAKRFKKTGSGKLMHARAGGSHLNTRKSSNRKRRLRKGGLLTTSMSKRIQKLVCLQQKLQFIGQAVVIVLVM